jgi:hypothetical protein
MPETFYRRMSRNGARLVLGLVVAAILLLVIAALMVHAPAAAPTLAQGDLALYGRIVDRLRDGQGYYPAMHAELLRSGYPTAAVFNWRTPLLLSLVALAPSTAIAQAALAVIAIGAGGLWLALLWRIAPLAAGMALPLTILAYAAAVTPQTVTFGEIVAGFLVLASAGCYGLRWPLAGMALALIALFVRELAAPYVLICGAMALLAGRRGEIRLAAVGVVAFAIYYGVHVAAVLAQLGPNEPSDASSWLSFGGPGFLVETAAFNGLFLLMPRSISAIVLPLALLGLFAVPPLRRMALAVAAYALLFLFIGKPFNDYWGAIYTPLLTPGLVLAWPALRDLAGAAARHAPLAGAASHAADGL